MDKTSEIKKPVINATVDLHPLIVVDVLNCCCSEKFERSELNIKFSRIRQMIPRLREFTDEYRRLGGKIIWVRSTPWREEYLPKNINRLYRENPYATFYTEHDVEESVEFYDGINPRKPDEIFTKNTYSAFADAHLQRLFQKHRWDTYLLSGVFAEACVNATLIDGFTKGLFTIILSDLVETMDDKEQQAHKKHLLTHQWPLMYGHVMTSSKFLKKLAK
ncbi:isochorismatase family protein [Candidatus Bathyarchaeota archaeon]|nr:isochorismatase family protein [Candidatus Bathyarchaeota archaeon]